MPLSNAVQVQYLAISFCVTQTWSNKSIIGKVNSHKETGIQRASSFFVGFVNLARTDKTGLHPSNLAFYDFSQGLCGKVCMRDKGREIFLF